MLEIINVVKDYKPKKGAPVRALDGVSIKFPEKGMVFILGKSGSGKSTLFNVMGGLDKYDDGEIIIKGKSSKNFTQGEFDSYRNTYLGFIFQEYNILNEFSVGANIALALELQGVKATSEKVNEILEEVDLTGYGNRKPSELSGGQKQRVAIARALVKNPEIIMADEPTGALDSNTGIQVFDTLKKLSNDKLVLVITHDREFAELYGDRVIELKDGKVISDIEKFKAESEAKNDSVSIVDNRIIQIKKGYKLTNKDLEYINSYIAQNDTIISIDEKTNKDMKKFARIDDEGKKEVFRDTDESKIKISEEKNFKLIKSRLPFKNSFKIGASSLKNKPFRLFFTILLSMIAFTMFGLTDTMGAYNKYATTKNSFIDSEIDALSLQERKQVHNTKHDYVSHFTVNSSDEDIILLKEKTGLDFKGVYTPSSYSRLEFSESLDNYSNNGLNLLNATIGGYYETDIKNLNDLDFHLTGTLPSNFNEVAISEYAYRHFEKYGYQNGNVTKQASEITSQQIFLSFNPIIKIGKENYTVTAIIDTKFNYGHFAALDEEGDGNMLVNYLLSNELNDTVNYGYHGLAFVKNGFIADKVSNKELNAGIALTNANFYINSYKMYSNSPVDYENAISVMPNKVYSLKDIKEKKLPYFIKNGKTVLGENGIMLSFTDYYSIVNNNLYHRNVEIDKNYVKENMPAWYYEYNYGYVSDEEYTYDWLNENYNSRFDDCLKEVCEYSEEDINTTPLRIKIESLMIYLTENIEDNTYTDKTYKELLIEYHDKYGSNSEEYREKVILSAIENGEIMENKNIINALYGTVYSNMTGYEEYDLSMNWEGVYYEKTDNMDNTLAICDTLYEKLDVGDIGNYSFLITKMPSDDKSLTKIIKFSYDYLENNTSYNIMNGVMSTLNFVNEFIETLAKVFLYVGIGFAVFAALLLMNYISTSIAYKRSEIGILRAVGARSSDVFGIFFNESLIIAAINFLLATIASFSIVTILNSFIRKEYNILITLLNFGIRQILLILAISIGVAFIASFLPVYKIAKKRPVDAIKK